MALSGSCRPFRARRGPGRYLGFRRSGSTLGYIPAAASRLPSALIYFTARDALRGMNEHSIERIGHYVRPAKSQAPTAAERRQDHSLGWRQRRSPRDRIERGRALKGRREIAVQTESAVCGCKEGGKPCATHRRH